MRGRRCALDARNRLAGDRVASGPRRCRSGARSGRLAAEATAIKKRLGVVDRATCGKPIRIVSPASARSRPSNRSTRDAASRRTIRTASRVPPTMDDTLASARKPAGGVELRTVDVTGQLEECPVSSRQRCRLRDAGHGLRGVGIVPTNDDRGRPSEAAHAAWPAPLGLENWIAESARVRKRRRQPRWRSFCAPPTGLWCPEWGIHLRALPGHRGGLRDGGGDATRADWRFARWRQWFPS